MMKLLLFTAETIKPLNKIMFDYIESMEKLLKIALKKKGLTKVQRDIFLNAINSIVTKTVSIFNRTLLKLTKHKNITTTTQRIQI